MKNSAAIVLALFISVTMQMSARAQNAQISTGSSNSVLEIPSTSAAQPDPSVSDSFKDNAATALDSGSVAATAPPPDSSSGASAAQPSDGTGIAENDQNPAVADSDGARDPSYAGINQYLNQQSDYASYTSAYSGLPPAALIGPSPFVRFFAFRSMIATSPAFVAPMGLTPIPYRPFPAPAFGPPIFRYYGATAGPAFGRGGGGSFGGRIGFSHR